MLYFRGCDPTTWKYLEHYVPGKPDAPFLDVGSGTGRWSTRTAKMGCKVILMDASDGMLEAAAGASVQNMTWKKGDSRAPKVILKGRRI